MRSQFTLVTILNFTFPSDINNNRSTSETISAAYIAVFIKSASVSGLKVMAALISSALP